jgi:two-component system, OmpR family, sensor kinase
MTIRRRLALAYGAAILATVAVMGVLVWWQFGAALRQSLDQTLATRASDALTALENNGQAGLQEGDADYPNRAFVAMFDAGGNLTDATAGTPPAIALPPAGQASADVRLGGTAYAIHIVHNDTGAVVIAGSSLASIDDTLATLAQTLFLVGCIAALASLAGGWWLAGRALRPIAALTSEAGQIGATDLDRRLSATPRRDELGTLTDTLNGMLARVADGVRRQRTFVATASHDLRTPLASLQAELELADDDSSTLDELRAAIRAAHADAVRLGELARALLDLAAAGSDGRALARSSVRVDDLVEAVVSRIESRSRQRGIHVRQTAPDATAHVDRVRLEQALTNLVDNAITYSPIGSEVDVVGRLEAPAGDGQTSDPRWLILEVLDRGPGVPEASAERLFQPFERGSMPQGPGAGLGLATAAAAVRAHHGSIGVEPRDGGGSRFWLRVPA